MNVVQLGDVLRQAPPVRAGQRSYPILSMTMRGGLVPQQEKFKKSIASTDLSNYKVVGRGQLVVGFPIDEGVLSFQDHAENAIVSPAYGIWDISRPKDVHSPYLEKYLRSPRALDYYKAKLRGSTARRRSLPMPVFKKMPVPLPAVREQRRIADILDRADALRAKRREAIAHLDGLNDAVFLKMFGDPLTNPFGYQDSSLADLCDGPGDIKCGPFGTQLSKDEFKSFGIPLWGIRQVNAGFAKQPSEFLDKTTAERLTAYSIEAGDIVMTRKGDVGKCAIYPAEFSRGIMHSDVLRIRVGNRAVAAFVAHQLHHSRAIRRQVDLISHGTIMKGINVTKLKTIRVLLPPLNAQLEFEVRVRVIADLANKHRRQLAELDNLFLSLQDRAFKGEL